MLLRNYGGQRFQASRPSSPIQIIIQSSATVKKLGYSVSVSGDTAVVGGQWGPWAHIFVRDNTGSWSQQARLIDPEGEISLRRFGRSVSISGDTVLVGSSRGPYVFVRDPGDASGETWIQQARLIASPNPDDLNGNPVSISGDTALIRGRFGSAYVFVRDDTGSWSQQAKLIPSDPASRFGFSV